MVFPPSTRFLKRNSTVLASYSSRRSKGKAVNFTSVGLSKSGRQEIAVVEPWCFGHRYAVLRKEVDGV